MQLEKIPEYLNQIIVFMRPVNIYYLFFLAQ